MIIPSVLNAGRENVKHWERERHSLPPTAILSKKPVSECISIHFSFIGIKDLLLWEIMVIFVGCSKEMKPLNGLDGLDGHDGLW